MLRRNCESWRVSEFLYYSIILTDHVSGYRETNLKIKQAHPSTASLTDPHSVSLLRGHILSEPPNSSLYTYDGTFHLSSAHPGSAPTKIPVGPNQMLLRGAQLRNTGWVYGVIVNAGHETKLMRNATYVAEFNRAWHGWYPCSEAPIKRTAVERQVNRQILYLFLLLIVLSLVSTIGSSIRTWLFDKNAWYLRLDDESKNKGVLSVEWSGVCLTCISSTVHWRHLDVHNFV